MVRRIGSFVALLLVATFVLAACGTEDKGTEPTVTRVSAEGAPEPTVPGEEAQASAQAPAPSGEAAGPPVTIDVKLVDIQFEPNQITVPANSAVTVNLTNAGAASHTFTIDELGVDSGEIAPQGTGTVTFNSGTPAEYEFYCKVPGHKEAGMVGKLVVTAGPVGSAASPSPAGGEAATPAAAGSPAAAAATPDAAVSPASTPAAMGGRLRLSHLWSLLLLPKQPRGHRRHSTFR